MSTVRFGIVGSGMIAAVIANAMRKIEEAKVVAVASRRPENATAFAEKHAIDLVFDGWQELVASDQVDAVYIATPTSIREEVAIAAVNAKKHILAEKPFASFESLQRITRAVKDQGVAFMDATHFVHNPRTHQIKATQQEEIGNSQAVRTSFFFPFMDRTNIRLDTTKEPTGAVGDMAWYSMRAITEYLQPDMNVEAVEGCIVRDQESGAVVRGAGLIAFEDGKTSTFDFGYNAGVCLMDLDILGESGMFTMSDFVLDWKHGFVFDNHAHVVGYTKRTAMQSPREFEYIEADSDLPESAHLIRDFVKLTEEPSGERVAASARISEQTQYLLDLYWNKVK